MQLPLLPDWREMTFMAALYWRAAPRWRGEGCRGGGTMARQASSTQALNSASVTSNAEASPVQPPGASARHHKAFVTAEMIVAFVDAADTSIDRLDSKDSLPENE